MSDDLHDFLEEIKGLFSSLDYVRPESIPNIDLYMDQVTTFMDTQLESSKRHENDKILTKTMINNYAKNNLLPPPVKKKYSRDHMILLIFIYYFKNILSIGDIQSALKPITDKYFGGKSDIDMMDIYEEVFSLQNEEMNNEMKNIAKKYKLSKATFTDAAPEDKELLDSFSFICMLCFDIYVKKMVLENLIDTISEDTNKGNNKR